MKTKKIATYDKLINEVGVLQVQLEKLPKLSDLEKAKFDQLFAIDQLYYSNKLEGTTLTKEDIDEAIHGKRNFQAA
ncbi:MAG: hypothetical protein AAB480_04375 [Patescibacteria group bacterium]